jgi:lipopolysaccharide export system protein LptA
MRGARWLLLVIIAAIIGGVGYIYRVQRQVIRAGAPPKPAPLPDNLNSASQNWCYTESTAAYTKIELCAADALESKDGSHVDLKQFTILLHHRNGKTYDLVKSGAATLFRNEKRFYSAGEVQMTLDIPEQGDVAKAPISVRSSGVTFDTAAGSVDTDQPTHFAFHGGEGDAKGAKYDTQTRQLLMKSEVKVDWKSAKPHAKPMRVEAGSLEYHEAEAIVMLKPWGRLTRDHTQVEGENATIHLREDNEGKRSIGSIDAMKAHGTDDYPHRKLQYSAEQLWMTFDEEGAISKITAQTDAKLTSTSDTAETNVSANHVDMDFATAGDESTLTHVATNGNSVVTSKPLPAPGKQLPETHILRSDAIEMKMRDGGKEIETVSAHTPSTLEFLPNQPIQRHRTLESQDMLITYGAQNRLDKFVSKDARTRTEPNAAEKARNRGVSNTASALLNAQFDSKTGKLTSMEQVGNFTYVEGERKAKADRATFNLGEDLMQLDTGVSMSSATGGTTADHIQIDQNTGNFTAEGKVYSTSLPDQSQKKKSSEMLSGDDPLHVTAKRMVSTDRNRKVHYEGAVTMWQGANKIQGETVDLDRDKRTLVADRNVITNLWEQPKDDSKKQAARPSLTEVHAARLVYTEDNRRAYYTGGVALDRPSMQIRSHELQAFLSEPGADSRLERALADGAVRIVQSARDRTRTGTAEHSEYYTADQKILLTGGAPKFEDTKGNVTTGDRLTYFANDDRLLVNGSAAKPASSRVEGKPRK